MSTSGDEVCFDQSSNEAPLGQWFESCKLTALKDANIVCFDDLRIVNCLEKSEFESFLGNFLSPLQRTKFKNEYNKLVQRTPALQQPKPPTFAEWCENGKSRGVESFIECFRLECCRDIFESAGFENIDDLEDLYDTTEVVDQIKEKNMMVYFRFMDAKYRCLGKSEMFDSEMYEILLGSDCIIYEGNDLNEWIKVFDLGESVKEPLEQLGLTKFSDLKLIHRDQKMLGTLNQKLNQLEYKKLRLAFHYTSFLHGPVICRNVVQIQGAKGPYAAKINGVYAPVDEVVGKSSVYHKAGKASPLTLSLTLTLPSQLTFIVTIIIIIRRHRYNH